MGFYSNYVVPRFVTCACGSKPIVRQRQKVVPRARGKILEIGLGAGHNIPHYDHERVDRVIGIDPCETSWQLAQERVNAVPFDVEFLAGSAEDIPLDDDSVDSVLLTFALCTIPDPLAALSEAKRVMRPGGELVFCEHAQAPDESVQRWQARINPLWKRLAGGCNLNRDIVGLIRTAGFDINELEQMYLPNTPRIAGFNVWGTAIPRS
jgi:ubiquinone/menaquinone biosynthesis C-methylase UbiE